MGRKPREPDDREILDPPVVPEEGGEIELDAGFEAWTRRLFTGAKKRPPENDGESE